MSGSTHPDVDGVTAPPRGARRRHKTRTALISAGQSLFASRAMESVTIDDIVEAADVAKGSFYNHFDDKEGLAWAVSDQIQADCEAEIARTNRDVDDAAARVVRALCVMIAYAFAHPERLQAMLSLSQRRTIASTPLNTGVASDIARGMASGRLQGVSLEAGIIVVLGLIRTTVAHAIAEGGATPTADLAVVIGAAMLRALGVDQADASNEARAAVDELLAGKVVR